MRSRLRGALLWLGVAACIFGALMLIDRAGIPHWVLFLLVATAMLGWASVVAYRRGKFGWRFALAILGACAAFVAAGFFSSPTDLPLIGLAAVWPYAVLFYPQRRSVSGNAAQSERKGSLVRYASWSAGTLVLVAGLVGTSLWLDSRAGSAEAAAERQTIREEVRAFDQVLKQIDGTAHRLRYRVHLDRSALAVAATYARAQFVVHSCKQIASVSISLPRLQKQLTGGPLGNDCSSWLKTFVGEEDYLVRGSLTVLHNCGVGLGTPIVTNECVGFTTIGRYDYDSATGARTRHCGGIKYEVFLKRLAGHWYVVGTDAADLFGEGAPCTGSDAVLLRKRVPWK